MAPEPHPHRQDFVVVVGHGEWWQVMVQMQQCFGERLGASLAVYQHPGKGFEVGQLGAQGVEVRDQEGPLSGGGGLGCGCFSMDGAVFPEKAGEAVYVLEGDVGCNFHSGLCGVEGFVGLGVGGSAGVVRCVGKAECV